MNPGTAILIKLGIDSLVGLWANHAGKPPGWVPTEKDWQELADEVNQATPEARLALARARASLFPPKNASGATTAIEARD